jgi:hypothetical protein
VGYLLKRLNIFMENDKESEKISYKGQLGGYRPGAGRPKGSTNKISAREILETAEQMLGKPLIVSILEGYQDTITDGDRRHRVVYEKMLVDKVATQLLDVEVTDSEDAVEAKRRAFVEAMAQIASNKQEQ